MYRNARVRKTEADPRVHRNRPAHKLERAREDVETFASVRLSRLERGILALDRLIRRIGNDRRRPQDDSKVSFQHG